MNAENGQFSETPYHRDDDYPRRYRDERFRAGSGPGTHRRELRAIHRLLARATFGPGPWLDVPCGAGRLSDQLPAAAIRVDRSPAMLKAAGAGGPRACASAAALPFRDGTFAGVICHRLLHHVGESEERVRILRELARVTEGPVLVSFFHSVSLQHARRVIGRRLGKTRSGRSAVTLRRFLVDLDAAGLRAVAFQALTPFVSEQWIVLAERAGTAQRR